MLRIIELKRLVQSTALLLELLRHAEFEFNRKILTGIYIKEKSYPLRTFGRTKGQTLIRETPCWYKCIFFHSQGTTSFLFTFKINIAHKEGTNKTSFSVHATLFIHEVLELLYYSKKELSCNMQYKYNNSYDNSSLWKFSIFIMWPITGEKI